MRPIEITVLSDWHEMPKDSSNVLSGFEKLTCVMIPWK